VSRSRASFIGPILGNGVGTGAGTAAFSPTDISGLVGWWKADGVNYQDSGRTTLVAVDTDPVGSLTDNSGNGNHLAQATAGKRPLYRTGLLNSLPGLTFDGADDFLTRTLAQAQPLTLYAVIDRNTASYFFSGAGGSNWYWKTNELNFGSVQTVTTVVDGAVKLAIQVNGASSFLRISGVNGANGDPGANAIAVLNVACFHDQINCYDMTFYEAMLYSGAISGANLTSLDTYASRWGV
jgi:hypothetical protein